MDERFILLEKTRLNVLNATSSLDLATCNQISSGFKNNIIWNLGHILVTQHLLTNGLAGLDVGVDKALVDKYRKGTTPDGLCGVAEHQEIVRGLSSSVATLQADYLANRFPPMKEYQTSYGYTLKSIEDVLSFVSVHEALHLGYIMAIKRALGQ